MNPDDRTTATLLNRATSSVEPRTAHLVEASLARGRRLRRRRIGVQVGSGVAFCALATTIAVTLLPAASGEHRPATNLAGGPSRSSVVSPSPTVTTPARAHPVAHPTQASVLRIFSELAPVTATITRTDGFASHGSVGVVVRYDDGDGVVQMDVSVDYPPSGGGLGAACQISTCTRQPDGATLAVYQGSDRPGHPELQPKQWTVGLQHRGGYTINVTEWNASTEKTTDSVTRTLPPLTIAQLTAIVSSAKWTR